MGCVPVQMIQHVPVSWRDTARVLKKLHLLSAGQQKDTSYARSKCRIYVRLQALQPKVRTLNSPYSPQFPFILLASAGIGKKKNRTTQSPLSVSGTSQIDVLFLEDASFVNNDVRVKSFLSSFASYLFSLWSVCWWIQPESMIIVLHFSEWNIPNKKALNLAPGDRGPFLSQTRDWMCFYIYPKLNNFIEEYFYASEWNWGVI